MSSTVLTGGPTSATPMPAATTSQSSSGSGSGPTSSPLLFFVALGFGVVFTNLWIIVGVKYCFRYNQRNRRAQQDENGEPIDMTAMPRTHRRRREKKLMTMDEVNERFPLLKYKAWMTSRAEEGLSTAGGVAVPSQSRAASLRNADGVIGSVRPSDDTKRPMTPLPKQSTEEQESSPEAVKTSPEIVNTPSKADTKESAEPKDPKDSKEEMDRKAPLVIDASPNPATSQSSPPLTTVASSSEHVDDEVDEDDQIQMAIPTDLLANPGDSCAICIDTLEDDDDVRGLTCGHTFHASCLDPWLTSRRACCPLCKADYYVPKPRPEGEAAAEAERQERGRRPPGPRTDMPRPPQYTLQRNGGPRMLFPGRFMPGAQNRSRYQFPARLPRSQRGNRSAGNGQQVPAPAPEQPAAPDSSPEVQQPVSWRSRMRNPFGRRINSSSGNETSDTATAASNTEATPSALEAGQR